MSIINRKSVIMLIVVIFLSTNLFNIPSSIFRLLSFPLWVVVYAIVPLAWILLVISMVNLKKIIVFLKKLLSKALLFANNIIDYAFIGPIFLVNDFIATPVAKLLAKLNKAKSKIPILNDLTISTLIISGLILTAVSPILVLFNKSNFVEQFATVGFLLIFVGTILRLPKSDKNFSFVKSKKNSILLASIIGILIFVFITRNLLGKELVYGDVSHIAKETLKFKIEKFFSIWESSAFGASGIKSFGEIFTVLFLIVSNSNGAIYSFISKLLPILLSFISMYFLLSKLIENFYLRLIGSIIYIINPVTLAIFSLGHSMYILVLLPFMLYYLLLLIEDTKYRYLIIFTLFFTLVFYFYHTLMPAIVVFMALFLIAYLANSNLLKNKDMLRFYAKSFLLFSIIFFLLNLPYLYSMFNERNTIPDTVLKDYHWNYEQAFVKNIIRLAGNKGSVQQVLDYNSNKSWTLVGFILPIIVFYPLTRKKIDRLTYALMFSALGLIAITFILHNHKIGDILFNKFSYFAAIRNMIKLQIPLMFSYSLLASISLSHIVSHKVLRKAKYAPAFYLIIGFLYFYLIVYNWPYLSGYLGLDQSKTFTPLGVFDQIDYWIKEHDNGVFRTLIVPYYHATELHLQNLNPYIYTITFNMNPDLKKYLNFVEGNFDKTSNLSNLLGPLTVKYVVVNKVWTPTGFPFMFGSAHPDKLNAIMGKQNEFELVYNSENFTVYKNKKFVPLIHAVNNIVYANNIESTESYLQFITFNSTVLINDNAKHKNRGIKVPIVLSENLVNEASFERSTWEDRFEDCCMGEKGIRNISVSKSTHSTDGLYSLNLTASNHCACVSKKINEFSNSDSYKLSFDYKYISGENASYCIWFNGCQKCKQKLNLSDSNNWVRYETIFDGEQCTTDAYLYLYSNSYGEGVTTNLYDNVKVEKIVRMTYKIGNSLPIIKFNKLSPSKYEVDVKNANSPFVLVFSEAYHPKWAAYLNGELINEDNHIISNGYSNGWFIDKQGTYRIIIKYKPQTPYLASLVVSVLVFILLIVFLFNGKFKK